MASGLLTDYLTHGDAADRPATPDLYPLGIGLWWNDDSETLDLWDGAAWFDDIASGGGGGSAAWGAITGTLSDQADLQAALDDKANTADLATVATSGEAADVAYDNATSGLTATEVQAAIDELAASPGGGMTNPMTTSGDIIVGGTAGAPTRLGVGTDGQVLTIVSGAPAYATPSGGGGLTNWTEAVTTATPNTPDPVVSFSANNAASNVDAALIAKGTGATLAQIPNNTSAGGNKRGAYATDLQKLRGSGSEVASGARAFIGGGQRNTATAGDCGVTCGYQNVASASESFVGGGRSNTASGQASVVSGGNSNIASGAYSSIPGGQLNTADGSHSSAVGYKAVARGIYGTHARSSGGFNNFNGDGQSRNFYLCRQTTTATQATAASDNGTPGASNQVVLPNNSSFVVKGTINVRENATGDSASWEFTAHIKRGANAAATAMVAACTPVLIAADAGAAAWSVSVDADTTNGCLRCRVTGEASHNLKWGWDIYTCNEVVS